MIGAAVSNVLSDARARVNAERIRRETAAMPGVEHAATLLERLASEGAPIRTT
jgi:UDP:flavonoid glycosyltransferase YjiC (YdhE family)